MCEYKYIKDQLDKIYNHYGKENQHIKLIEEMAELTQAILKDDYKNYLEELADVSIVLEQIILKLDKKDKEQFEQVRTDKIERTLKRFEQEKLYEKSNIKNIF